MSSQLVERLPPVVEFAERLQTGLGGLVDRRYLAAGAGGWHWRRQFGRRTTG